MTSSRFRSIHGRATSGIPASYESIATSTMEDFVQILNGFPALVLHRAESQIAATLRSK